MTQVLTSLGISVTLLEAGPMLNPATDFKEHWWPHQTPDRGMGPGGGRYFGKSPYPFGLYDAGYGDWQLEGEPYTVAPATNSAGSARALWEGAPIITDESRCALPITISLLIPAMASARIGPSPMTRSLPITTKPRASSASPAAKKASAARRTESFKLARPPRVHEMLVQRACKQAEHSLHSLAVAVITQPDQRPAGVPLLRPVRARLRHGVELFVQPGAGFPGDEDRHA